MRLGFTHQARRSMIFPAAARGAGAQAQAGFHSAAPAFQLSSPVVHSPSPRVVEPAKLESGIISRPEADWPSPEESSITRKSLAIRPENAYSRSTGTGKPPRPLE